MLKERSWSALGEFGESLPSHYKSTSSSETSINLLLLVQWVKISYTVVREWADQVGVEDPPGIKKGYREPSGAERSREPTRVFHPSREISGVFSA